MFKGQLSFIAAIGIHYPQPPVFRPCVGIYNVLPVMAPVATVGWRVG